MANFNAGAIEGTLTLDRSTFERDMREAQAMAKKFEQNKIKIGVDLDYTDEFAGLKATMDAVDGQNIGVQVDLDGEGQIAELVGLLESIRDEVVDINVNVVGLDNALGLAAELKAIPDEEVEVSVDVDRNSVRNIVSSTRALNGMRFAIAGVAGLLPAFVPAIAGAGAVLVSLAGAAGIAGVGLAGFAAVAVPAWKRYTDAVKGAEGDLSKLPPQMRALKVEQDRLSAALAGMNTTNRVYAVIAGGFSTLATALSASKPFLDAVVITISQLTSKIDAFVKSPAFAGFVSFMTAEFGPTFMLLAGIIGNLIKTFASLTSAFQPFTRTLLGGLEAITAGWAEWAAGLAASDSFQNFIAYVQAVGPKVLQVFVAMGKALGNIMKALAPVAGPVLDALIAAFDFIANMDTSALGALLIGISTAIVLFQAVTAAVALFNLVMAANPIVLVVIAVIALVAAFIYLWKTNEGFRNFFIGVWNAIWGFMKAVGAWFAGPFAGFFVGAFNRLMSILSAIGSFFATVWNAIKAVVLAVVGFIVGFVVGQFNAIKAAITAVLGVLSAIWSAFWGVFGGVITAAINFVVALVKLQFAIIKEVISDSVTVIKTVVIGVWNAIKSATIAVWNATKTFVVGVWNSIKSQAIAVWNALKSAIIAALNSAKSQVTAVINGIKGVAKAGWDSIKNTAKAIWDLIPGGVKTALGKIPGIVSSAISTIKGLFSGAASWLVNAGRNIIQGLLNGIESMIGAVTSKLNQLTNLIPKVKGPEERDKKLLRPAGRWIMGGLIDEISRGMDQTLAMLGDFTPQIPNALELEQQLRLMPTVAAPQTAATAGKPLTKEEFVAAMAELIEEMRRSMQPLIGEFNASDQDPRELAEQWWFITKGRG